MNLLNTLLEIIATAAAAAAPLVPAGEGQQIDQDVEVLVQIAQKAAAAHQQIAGKPLDLSVLQPIDPVA